MGQGVYTLHPRDEEGIRKALFYELLEKERPRLLATFGDMFLNIFLAIASKLGG